VLFNHDGVVEVEDAKVIVLVNDQIPWRNVLVHHAVAVVQIIYDRKQLAQPPQTERPRRGVVLVERATGYVSGGEPDNPSRVGIDNRVEWNDVR
jgi:hypothetical protein